MEFYFFHHIALNTTKTCLILLIYFISYFKMPSLWFNWLVTRSIIHFPKIALTISMFCDILRNVRSVMLLQCSRAVLFSLHHRFPPPEATKELTCSCSHSPAFGIQSLPDCVLAFNQVFQTCFVMPVSQDSGFIFHLIHAFICRTTCQHAVIPLSSGFESI